jgi:quercetin dioxygenase-like cupin family protein
MSPAPDKMSSESAVALFRWDDMPKEVVTDMFSRRLIWGERVMLAQVFLKKGAVVPKHAHENEQVSYVVKGVLRFWVGDEAREQDVRAGEVLRLPSNVPHKAEALEEMTAIDVFSPPRHDWIQKTDDYLRK